MQFSRTLSETVRERDQLLLGPAGVTMLVPDDFHSLGDIRPAVTLIRDQRLQYAKRGRPLLHRPDQFDRSEQGRRIPEACHLGQESSYLQLRVDAGFEPAKSLEHHAADTDRRIRLFARAALDVGCCRSFALDAAEQARSSKGEAGDCARTVAIIRAQPGQQHADEPVVGKGIDQNAARGVVLHLSQYGRCWGLRVPQNAHRKEIFARRLTSRRDVQDQDDGVVARTQRDGIRNADIRNT